MSECLRRWRGASGRCDERGRRWREWMVCGANDMLWERFYRDGV